MKSVGSHTPHLLAELSMAPGSCHSCCRAQRSTGPPWPLLNTGEDPRFCCRGHQAQNGSRLHCNHCRTALDQLQAFMTTAARPGAAPGPHGHPHWVWSSS